MNANASEFSPAYDVVHHGGSATQRVIPPAPDHDQTGVAATQPSGGRSKKERSRRDGKTASGAAPKQGAPQARSNGKGVSSQTAKPQSKESGDGKGASEGTKTKPTGSRRKQQRKVKKDEASESVSEPVAHPPAKRGGRGNRRGRGGRIQPPMGKRVIEDDAMSVSSVASSQSTLSSMSSTSTYSTSDLPLRERLERDLSNEKYRCAICMEFIRKEQKIWSCPHCFVVLHMFCMKEWMFSNLDTATRDGLPKQARSVSRFVSFFLSPTGFLGYLHTHDVLTVLTRCPQCRMELHVPTILSGCFCGNGIINDRSPEDLPAMPHSCGRICGRSRGPFCAHPCGDVCHPGPCHPCSAIIPMKCRCGRTEWARRSRFTVDRWCAAEPIPAPCSARTCAGSCSTARNTRVRSCVTRATVPPARSRWTAAATVEPSGRCCRAGRRRSRCARETRAWTR